MTIEHSRWLAGLAGLALAVGSGAGCGSNPVTGSVGRVDKPGPAPQLGSGNHQPSSVVFTEIATEGDGLKTPRDLAFNPLRPDELWAVNLADESVVIVHAATNDTRTAERRKDGYALHFMAKPAAISFGADETTIGLPGTFGSCGESRDTYDDTTVANDFMGPALWSSDLSIFAEKNPHMLGSHLDMLHNTPLCMGIEHQEANIYWTFDGLTGSISKYDFKKDNGVGNDDHSDGQTFRYVTGQVKYAKGVPSHLAYHAADQTLFIADSGNGRIAKLDTTTGQRGTPLKTLEPQGPAVQMNGAMLEDAVPAGTDLRAPSGLEIHNEILYVSDNASGLIYAYSLDGKQLNFLDTGLGAGALAGLAFGPDDKLYFVDMTGNRIVRVDPKK